MWKPGEVIAWRGIFRERVWHAMPTIVVKDTPQEIVLALIPGAECMVEENYARHHKRSEKRRWDFINEDWKLEKFTWHTNRLLHVIEVDKYYSTVYFWNHENNEFLFYYINFQLPFRRNHCSIDTLDLDLDIVINPDFSFEWKDLDDYQRAIEAGVIQPQWADEIEIEKAEVLHRLEKREYPFDNSWLDWGPDPDWSTPTLPNGWDKI
jgi:protein associated with RNAse G/E